jgi:hypothetical protein
MPDNEKGGSLAARLEAAKRAASALEKVTEELNGRFEAVEKLLIDLRLGVSGAVDLWGPELVVHNAVLSTGFVLGAPPPIHVERTPVPTLEFRKHNNDWGLYIVYQGPKGMVRLASAPREHRVLAAAKLEWLIDHLLERAVTQIADVTAGLQTVDAVLENLRGGKP